MDVEPSGSFNTVPYVLFSALIAHQVLRRYEPYILSFYALIFLAPPALITALSAHYDKVNVPGWVTILSTYAYTLALYFASLAASVLIYRLSPFHPLARYPGPLPGRLSAFWFAYLSLDGREHRFIKTLHERYGDVVRIGPNTLSIRKPSATTALLGTSGAPKGPHQKGRVLSDTRITMIAIQEIDVHLQRRRAWARGFTPAALKGYEEQSMRRVNQLVRKLEEQKGKALLDQWLNYFTYDFMSDMAFGGGSDLLSGKEDRSFWRALNKTAISATFFGNVPWVGIFLGRIPFLFSANQAFLSRCRDNAARRLAHGTMIPDLFHYLNHEDLQSSEKNEPRPPMERVINDGILAMVAGVDTSSGSMTSILACLLAHPEAYAKLQAEVDRFYPPGDAISTKYHRDMHYLSAVINEAFRLFPPVPMGTQRQVPLSGGGVTVDSMYIPPGTIFWVHAYSLFRDPSNFSSPEAFIPERWLAAETGAGGGGGAPSLPGFVHNESAFIPFSLGPMNCVGKALALQQIRLVVCAILQRFRVRPQEGWSLDQYHEEYLDYFVTVRGNLPVVLEVREGKEEL